MLPPIPQGLVPVNAQHDPVKPIPAVAPVAPAKENAKGSSLGLEDDEGSTAQERARDEQRRQHQQQREAQQAETDELSELDTVAPSPDEVAAKKELSRKGVWIDISV